MGTLTPSSTGAGGGGASLCPGPPTAWGDISTPVTLGLMCWVPLTLLSRQSEEDKQLQDELEMLVERLGVSVPCPQPGAVAQRSPGQGFSPSDPSLMVVPCAGVERDCHPEQGPCLSAVLCPPASLPL